MYSLHTQQNIWSNIKGKFTNNMQNEIEYLALQTKLLETTHDSLVEICMKVNAISIK